MIDYSDWKIIYDEYKHEYTYRIGEKYIEKFMGLAMASNTPLYELQDLRKKINPQLFRGLSKHTAYNYNYALFRFIEFMKTYNKQSKNTTIIYDDVVSFQKSQEEM